MSGGPPRFFALLTTEGGTVLAGTCGRGTSRSADGGRSWTPGGGQGDGVVHDLAAGADGTLWAATADGLFRSDDDGGTWAPAGLGGVTLYGIDTSDGLRVGTLGRGIASSGDGGRSWTFADELAGVTVYRVLGPLAATEDRGVWRRTSDGWTPAGIDGRSVFALARLGDRNVLAGTRGDGLHSSDDDGATWSPLTSNLPDTVVHTLVVARDGSVVAGTGAGTHRSRDGGVTWEPFGGGELANRRVFSLALSDDGSVFAGSYDGVWRVAADGGRVEPVDTGLSPAEAFTVAVAPDGTAFAGTRIGCLRSDDAGASWQPAPGPDGIAVHAIAFTADGAPLLGTADGVWSTTPVDLPGRWVFSLLPVDDGRLLAGTIGAGLFGGGALDAPIVYDLVRTRDGAVLAATGAVVDGVKTGGIFRSTDDGRTWIRAGSPPMTVYRIVEDGDGRLFAGAQRCAILRSDDGGRTWDARQAVDEDEKLYCLAIDRAGRLYLAAGARLLRSDDDGESWHPLDDDLLDGLTVYDLVEHPDGALLAATSAGMVRFRSNG